mmetsp:Transcript_16644/g.24966  ORF Transcript_16644/g.24966 Transcript_16644/m.24966 type:complete len:208 (+) Transcript_16644:99-722(+)
MMTTLVIITLAFLALLTTTLFPMSLLPSTAARATFAIPFTAPAGMLLSVTTVSAFTLAVAITISIAFPARTPFITQTTRSYPSASFTSVMMMVMISISVSLSIPISAGGTTSIARDASTPCSTATSLSSATAIITFSVSLSIPIAVSLATTFPPPAFFALPIAGLFIMFLIATATIATLAIFGTMFICICIHNIIIGPYGRNCTFTT